MKVSRPFIHLQGIQIKSLEKARDLAAALGVIETECGIHEVEISLKDIFICPWIDLSLLNRGPMEELLQGLLMKLDRARYGKDSRYRKGAES